MKSCDEHLQIVVTKIMIILFEKNGAKKTIRTINCARDRMVVLVRNQFYSNDCKD